MTTAYAWMRRIRDRDDLPSAAKTVAVMLGLRADKDNTCTVSHGRLAQDCGLGHSTTRREVARLRDLGLLLVIPMMGAHGQRANTYVLVQPPSPNGQAPVDNPSESEGGVPPRSRGMPPRSTPRGATTWHQKYIPKEVRRTDPPPPVDNAVHALVTHLAKNRKP